MHSNKNNNEFQLDLPSTPGFTIEDNTPT